MADLRLRISIVEKNSHGQEVELVRKAIQFNAQVRMSAKLGLLRALRADCDDKKDEGVKRR